MMIHYTNIFSVTACIRRQEGFCCIQYQVCADVLNGFSLSGTPNDAGQTDTNCIHDYIIIPGKVRGLVL